MQQTRPINDFLGYMMYAGLVAFIVSMIGLCIRVMLGIESERFGEGMWWLCLGGLVVAGVGGAGKLFV